MITTKVFMSGNSQAVRLPKAFRLDVDEVEIFRRGDEIVLRRVRQTPSFDRAFDILTEIPGDVFDDIRDARMPEERTAD